MCTKAFFPPSAEGSPHIPKGPSIAKEKVKLKDCYPAQQKQPVQGALMGLQRERSAEEENSKNHF